MTYQPPDPTNPNPKGPDPTLPQPCETPADTPTDPEPE